MGLHGNFASRLAQDHCSGGPHQARHLRQHVGRGEHSEEEKNDLIFVSQVNATYYKSAGAVGCITDGGVRDLLEMKNVGFHAMSRGVTISHAFGVSILFMFFNV